MNLHPVNRGFLYGCAAAILFITGKIAKFGGTAASKELLIYILVILAGGLTGGLIWQFGRMLLRRDRRGHRRNGDV